MLIRCKLSELPSLLAFILQLRNSDINQRTEAEKKNKSWQEIEGNGWEMKNSFVSISHSGNNVLGAINPADLARISRKNILPPWLSYLKPAAVIVTQQQLLSRPGEEIKVCWGAMEHISSMLGMWKPFLRKYSPSFLYGEHLYIPSHIVFIHVCTIICRRTTYI